MTGGTGGPTARALEAWAALDEYDGERVRQAMEQRTVPRFDGIHCDQLTCNAVATKRVRPQGIPIRGMLYCDEHAEMLLVDGRKRGREWACEPLVKADSEGEA